MVERSRVEQQALQCCVHGGELMVLHCGGWKVLPSMRRRQSILDSYHGNGHVGAAALYRTVKGTFYWPYLRF